MPRSVDSKLSLKTCSCHACGESYKKLLKSTLNSRKLLKIRIKIKARENEDTKLPVLRNFYYILEK